MLVGHEFTSSFKEDHTDFSEARVAEIKQGETKEAGVLELLGRPTGLYVFPLVAKDTGGSCTSTARRALAES